MELIISLFSIIFFLFASIVMMLFGIKTIKNHKVDIELLKIFNNRFGDSPEIGYRLFCDKKTADKKISEFYSNYRNLSLKKINFLGIVFIILGTFIFIIDLFLLSKIF